MSVILRLMWLQSIYTYCQSYSIDVSNNCNLLQLLHPAYKLQIHKFQTSISNPTSTFALHIHRTTLFLRVWSPHALFF